MIGALKNKDLGQAKRGYKIDLACLVILSICIGLDSVVVLTRYTFKAVLMYSLGLVPLLGLYYFFVIFNPVAKIIGHLERREALAKQSTSPYNA